MQPYHFPPETSEVPSPSDGHFDVIVCLISPLTKNRKGKVKWILN
ncbi:hypothetical protein ES703_46526 [subsurface metagenome]